MRNNIISNHDKETKILFYKIQNQTSSLLAKLLHQYTIQKELLLQKHQTVKQYVEDSKENPLEINLKIIYEKINTLNNENHYNIYLTNKDLVIQNTTFKKDKGFDISFAKSTFNEHFEKNIIGICTPLFEKSSKQFLSYTDSYLSKDKNNVLQVSYTYKSSINKLLEIQNLISLHPNVVDAKAYIIVDSGFVNDIILKDFPSYKPNLKEILARIKDGSKINSKLKNRDLTINNFDKDDVPYTEMHIATTSSIFDDTKIIYSILLDDTILKNKLNTLNIFMAILTILGVLAILSTNRLRRKESKFNEQDSFIQSSMHEIKTPLSIITLNNELRELEFGRDEYSLEIDSAIKTLKTSYEDMSFTITKDKLDYQVETLKLSDIVKQRVEYFQTIAKSNSKSIFLSSDSHCEVDISTVELIRLIDNNLSNAIKYSSADSHINVSLNGNILSFHNYGTAIKNSKNIFDKYFRENKVIGGHGLGLNIVKEVAKKYSVDISLTSTLKDGTTFSYKFKCHTNDISK